MGRIKKSLCFIMAGLMLLLSTGFLPVTASAEETASNEPAGWYLKDYKLVINTKKTTGAFSQGGTYSDIVSIFDTDGNEMTGLESDFENDILLKYGRYSNESGDFFCGYDQTISWDSPEDYYSEGTIIELTGISNLEVAHYSWGCRSISARFNMKTRKDTYSYVFVDTGGSDQFASTTSDITVRTNRAIPKAVNGDIAYLTINFDYSTRADSQAVYTYEWKAPTKALKAKTYNTAASKKGWYLTAYSFEYKEEAKYYESTFGDGSLCIDTVTLYDADGDTGTSYLENDLNLYNERYGGAYATENFLIGVRSEIKWDSPTSYLVSGASIKVANWSNTVIASSGSWGTTYAHFYANTTGFSTELYTPSGDSWPYATPAVDLTSGSILPEGTQGQNLNVYLEIGGAGRAVYTYTWKNAELSAPSVTKSNITLYLAGTNKKLTYQIGLKNSDGYSVTYKSRKTSVAAVSKTGLITAKKAGNANIVITFKSGGKTITKTIKVVVKAK